MFPFRSRINPFSGFTINLGPLYVERVFDSLLTKVGVKGIVLMNPGERFTLYLDYLKSNIDVHNHTQYAITQFYKGHFYQQLAVQSIADETARHFQEKALCYYQNYLELNERADESRFYAQWQTGLLQDTLNYAWPAIEDSLQRAANLDPLRGEPEKKITEYYIGTREWKKAYIHSKNAVERHFDKNPVAHRRWFVDFDAYNWSVLTRHHTICLYLGYVREAEEANTRKKIVIAG
jgi:hypothetical protein